jgi:hypothetical protein
MRMTAVHAQTERKRQDWSARCAEKYHRQDRSAQLCVLIRHVSAVRSIKAAAQGEERLSSVHNQAIVTLYDRPLGERWFSLRSLSIQLARSHKFAKRIRVKFNGRSYVQWV